MKWLAVLLLSFSTSSHAFVAPRNMDFDTIDTNKDSVLSQAEIHAELDKDFQMEVEGFFGMFDKDGDKRITRDEYTGDMAVESYFTDTDADKDDVMTWKEVMTHFDEGHPEQIDIYLK